MALAEEAPLLADEVCRRLCRAEEYAPVELGSYTKLSLLAGGLCAGRRPLMQGARVCGRCKCGKRERLAVILCHPEKCMLISVPGPDPLEGLAEEVLSVLSTLKGLVAPVLSRI